MKLALLATLPLLLLSAVDVPAQTPSPRKPAAKPAPTASSTLAVTVTDLSGAPLTDVRVNLTGSLDRSGSTQGDGTIRFDGLRAGVYRLRFEKEGFVLFEREVDMRAGQPAPAPSVALTPATDAAPPPVATPPTPASKPAELPPPGKPLTVAVPDFIERNLITNSQPQKTSSIGCSGVASALLWQIREPWENRTHSGADAMLYVVGGEGTLRLDGRDTQLEAGSFAQVPRGSSYTLSRKGRSPLFVLATLAGEACQ